MKVKVPGFIGSCSMMYIQLTEALVERVEKVIYWRKFNDVLGFGHYKHDVI